MDTAPASTSFRNTLPTADASGGRRWLYPRRITGRFTRWRTVVAVMLLIALFAGPFVWVDGHPLFLFNVLERRFIVFGVPFWPQDFYLVAFGLVTFIVFIALFTVVYGRVWCGWACPQTIFMEIVFRKIEGWIEGDANARRRLDASPWTTEKIVKKSLKHGIFFLIAFAISNTFLTYLIGRDQWLTLVADNPAEHLGGLATILLFTGVFYFVFARLREIVCTTICPYGRLQGVLLDKNSLMVAYDYKRGEPRGKKARGVGQGAQGVGSGAWGKEIGTESLSGGGGEGLGGIGAEGVGDALVWKEKVDGLGLAYGAASNHDPHALPTPNSQPATPNSSSQSSNPQLPTPQLPNPHPNTLIPLPLAPNPTPFPPKGDCIDCKLCVQVCPMGIDIRNGSQLECINCTSCVDACDDVMTRINRPKGLIRMDSLEGIETGKPFRFTGRMRAYTFVLVALLGVMGYLLLNRPMVDVTVLRAPGQLFQREAGGQVSNLYLVEVVNKTYRPLPVQFRVQRSDAQLRFVQPLADVPAGELTKGMFFINLPEASIHQNSTKLTIDVLANGQLVDQIETTLFIQRVKE